MIVMKFGGSSVATPENILKVKKIVAESDSPNVIVISAFGGCTGQLKQLSQLALTDTYEDSLDDLENRHLEAVRDLLPVEKQSEVIIQVKQYFNELEDFCSGISLLRELSDRSVAKLLSYGELLSTYIISEMLNHFGVDISLLDTRKIIVTDDNYLLGKVDFEETNRKIRESVKSQKSYIVPGFIASSESNKTTTLGFGGSDYTAAIFASALDAERLEIWSDVDGMLTGNPGLIGNASTINELTYNEALELSHFGAKVLYPLAIQPVLQKGITLLLKNTFRPSGSGTKIHHKVENNNLNDLVGISSLNNISLLTVSGVGMIGITGYSSRVFGALSQYKINVILISQSCSEYTICIGIKSDDREKAVQAFEETFEYEYNRGLMDPVQFEDNLSIVALVGDKMKFQPGISGKAFSALGENGINVKAIAQGSSERNISIVIDAVNEKKTINVLHERFFANVRKRVHLFVVGTGNVGKEFLKILHSQNEQLTANGQLELRIIGISNSRKMLFREDGVDADQFESILDKEGNNAELEDFVEKMISYNLRNSIFVDNTASNVVPKVYEQILNASISLVTCNKIAPSDTYIRYEKLKLLARKKNIQFRFETCVGAALPVINTMDDLITSGDKVLKIEAVLSGSLNFILNNYDTKKPFSEVVQEAKDAGLTEPDPLIDLSGVDVMRKILILAREAGYKLEMADVRIDSLLPSGFQPGNKDQLFNELMKHEDHFQALFRKANKIGKKLKFVAYLDNGKAGAGLKEISPDSIFYGIDGKDNIVSITTERYCDQPLVIRGPGAGAEVTASGIFSDIMRIVNQV